MRYVLHQRLWLTLCREPADDACYMLWLLEHRAKSETAEPQRVLSCAGPNVNNAGSCWWWLLECSARRSAWRAAP